MRLFSISELFILILLKIISMKRGMSGQDNQNKLFLDSIALKTLSQISPRITLLYERLDKLYIEDKDYLLSPQDFTKRLTQLCEAITYKQEIIGGPICRQHSKKTKFYHCFDCEYDVPTSICQECFSEGQHTGHNFRMYDVGCYCDCGNEAQLNKQYFCSRHKDFIEPKPINESDALIFSKEVQFLLLLSVKAYENLPNASLARREALLVATLTRFLKYIKENYNYQKLASEVLLGKFSQYYNYRQQPILEILMRKIDWTEKTTKILSEFITDLHSVYKIRKEITIQYWNIIKQGNKSIKGILKMNNISDQFLAESNIILKLLRKGKIHPIYVQQGQLSFREEISRHLLVLSVYEKLSQSKMFPLIMAQMLPKMEIWQLYNNHFSWSSQRQQTEVLKFNYICIILKVVQAVLKLHNGKLLLLKMVKQSLQYFKENRNRSGSKITFSLCLFAYFDFNLQAIKEFPAFALIELAHNSNIEQILSEVVLDNPTMIFNMEADRSQESNPQLILSVQYLFYKIAFILLNKFERELPNSKAITLERYLTQIHQVESFSNILGCQEISYQCCSLLLNVFYAFQTELPQLIIANYFKHPKKEKVIDFYRQLCSINRELSKLQFKMYAQLWIPNEECLKEFIINQFSQYFKHEQSKKFFDTNLSFLSQFCKLAQTQQQQVEKRLNMNLSNQRKCPQLQQVITSNVIQAFNKKLKSFNGKEPKSKRYNHRNFLTQLLFGLFLWNRNGLYLQIIQNILKNEPEEEQASKLYRNSYKRIDEDLKKMELQGRQIDKAQMKQKKLDKLAQLKMKQQKCLNQYKQQELQSKAVAHLQAQTCIICKSHRQERLHYLCQLKISLNLVRNVLKEDGYFVLITTCGHSIHLSCLTASANQYQTYSTQFRCFLCKKITNLRVPAYQCYNYATEKELVSCENQERKTILNKLVEQLLTVMSIAIAEKEDLEYVRKDIEVRNFGNIIKRSLILSIYFYFLSWPKLYSTNFLPVLKPLCSILKFFKYNNRQTQFQSFASKNPDKALSYVQDLIESIIGSLIIQENNYHPFYQEQGNNYNQLHQLQKLRQYLLNKEYAPFNFSQRIDRLHLYKMPYDLLQLNKEGGPCSACKHISSRLKICFFCGLKICVRCKPFLNRHLKAFHAGRGIMIEAQFGQHYYYENETSERCYSLYSNYIGQAYAYEHKKPKSGEYLLDPKLYQTLLTNGLLQNMKDLVEAQQRNETCIIQ